MLCVQLASSETMRCRASLKESSAVTVKGQKIKLTTARRIKHRVKGQVDIFMICLEDTAQLWLHEGKFVQNLITSSQNFS